MQIVWILYIARNENSLFIFIRTLDKQTNKKLNKKQKKNEKIPALIAHGKLKWKLDKCKNGHKQLSKWIAKLIKFLAILPHQLSHVVRGGGAKGRRGTRVTVVYIMSISRRRSEKQTLNLPNWMSTVSAVKCQMKHANGGFSSSSSSSSLLAYFHAWWTMSSQ